MAYFTEPQLSAFATSPGLIKEAAQYNFSTASDASVTIFLSHSHKDRVLAKGIIKHMASLGIDVYVDWNDSDMPRITNRETADRIKKHIEKWRVFMVLATQNALESRWVPWEIGIADKTKGEHRILIIPVADASGEFTGNEYLQLYRRVIIAESGRTGVFEPGQEDGDFLGSYMKKYGV